MRVLIIEDNVSLIWRLQVFLGKYFETSVAKTGKEGQQLAAQKHFDVILLDLHLPDMGGEEICESLRQKDVITPILVLTAEDDVETKVRLFSAGADDYLTKPFEKLELLARIQALLRRRQIAMTPSIIMIDDLMIDLRSHTVERGGADIPLRRKEYEILEYLAHNRGKIVTPEMIVAHVWGENTDVLDVSMRVQLKRMRDKVDKPFKKQLIKTERGVGYCMMDDVQSTTHIANATI